MQKNKQPLLKIISSLLVLLVFTCPVALADKMQADKKLSAKKISYINAKDTKAVIRSLSQETGTGIFLSITDIHFDPYADTSIVKDLNNNPVSAWPKIFANAGDDDASPYGVDAGYVLASSAVKAASNLTRNYDFILYSGDYLSHDFRATYNQLVGGTSQEFNQFAIKTMRYVSYLLSSQFNGVPIYGTLGNNDAICGDYMISPKSPLLMGIAPQWSDLSQQPDAFTDFTMGGFYKVKHPVVTNHDIIVLNNIFWSNDYRDSCETSVEHPGDAMMAWLEWQLYQSNYRGRTTTLLMHVPPGINAYSSSKGWANCQDSIQPFWQDRYTTSFLNLLQNYNGVITNGFTGHTHMDNFRVISVPQGNAKLPLHVTPAVSPIFSNNPAFKVVQYDTSNAAILNSLTFVVSNLEQASQGQPLKWKIEYVATSAYNLPDLSARSLTTLASDIVSSETTRNTFMSYYAAQTPKGGPMTEQNWHAFACAQTNITKTDFANCYCK